MLIMEVSSSVLGWVWIIFILLLTPSTRWGEVVGFSVVLLAYSSLALPSKFLFY